MKRSKEEIDDKKDEQKEESGEEKQGTKDVKDKVEKEKTINTEDTDAEETKTTRSEEEPEEQVDDKRKNVDENENKQDENHPIMQIKKTDEIPVKRVNTHELVYRALIHYIHLTCPMCAYDTSMYCLHLVTCIFFCYRFANTVDFVCNLAYNTNQL